MSKIARIMQQAAAGAVGEALAIEDVFSTYLYLGNGSTQTITNGIDLAGEGGLVWIKRRDASNDHYLHDTLRGSNYALISNETLGQINFGSNALNAFNSDGFSVGDNSGWNGSGQSIASWTFRKAPRFFDVVTYTGNGTNPQTINHNLGVEPGCIIIKRTNGTTNWQVYHRGLNNGVNPNSYSIVLNSTNAQSAAVYIPTTTDTYFTIGGSQQVGGAGMTYVAYLFAHDPLGPSGDGSDGLIACGVASYPVSGDVEVDLGWEPQWVLLKDQNHAGQPWWIIDTTRGWAAQKTGGTLSSTTGGKWQALFAESNSAELDYTYGGLTSTGFKLPSNNNYGDGNTNYIYIAIRRGPMREPTSGTEVFAVDNYDAVAPYYDSTFPVDFAINKSTSALSNSRAYDRLRGGAVRLAMDTSTVEAASTESFDFMNGWNGVASASYYSWMFRRAPGFFDVVAYTGNGVAGRTMPHNLGVAPELMIVRKRDAAGLWRVYHKGLNGGTNPEQYGINLNETSTEYDLDTLWNDTAPTSSVFSLGTQGNVNGAGSTYISYLFATLPGISKVGSYTGNGSSQTINCGFTSGARFILIKRTDSTGDWYVWDTARGIVSGNDPHLSLNTTATEVTSDDTIDPDSSGFIVNQVSATNVNVSSASYIYLAIA